MYREIHLKKNVTIKDLKDYGFKFNGVYYVYHKGYKNRTTLTVIANVSTIDKDETFINYKVSNMNTDLPYAPYYSRRYSENNAIADDVEFVVNKELDKMVQAGLIEE